MDSKDISVVVQGSTLAEYNGERCIASAVSSIRNILPDARVIVSTWENEQLPAGLAIDKVVYNKDPGFKTRDGSPNGKQNNVNRQIVSTLGGLKEVETKYALKMRSDFIMKGSGFTKHFDRFNAFDENYRIFRKRIVCYMFGTRKPRAKRYNLPFHIADFTHFGLTVDLLNLFDIPLVTEEEFDWFLIHTDFMPNVYARNKYNAEQSIWINCLIKNGVDVKCGYSTHVDDEIIEQSERFLVNNFLPISHIAHGVWSLKSIFHTTATIPAGSEYYTYIEWLNLYKKYCDAGIIVPARDREREIIDQTIEALEKFDREKLSALQTGVDNLESLYESLRIATEASGFPAANG